jgi:hypothetical protein
MENINKGDVVLHELSGLYYRCENKQQARWMNMNPYYKFVPPENTPPPSYFKKN